MKTYTLPLIALAFGAGVLVADQASQTSQSTTSQGGTTTATASGSAQVGGSASSSSSGQGRTSTAGSGGGQRWSVTRPTHVAIYSPNPVGNNASVASASIWQDQARYFQLLGNQGKLLYAGPWRAGGGALLILNCESDQEAQNLVDEDPVVKSLMFVANVKGWSVSYIGPWVVSPEPGARGGPTDSTSGGSSGSSTGKGSGGSSTSSSQSGGGQD